MSSTEAGCTVTGTAAGFSTDWQGLALRQFRRARAELETVLAGTADELLDARPLGLPNSMGWIVWHLIRGIDRNVSEMAGREQIWISHGWAERCGRAPDPSDTGFGHSVDDVAAFRSPSGADLLAYHAAVLEVVGTFLLAIPDDDLRRSTTSPTLKNTCTVEERLAALCCDTFCHLGQLSVLRTLLARDLEAT